MEGTGDFGNTNTESDFQTLAALPKKMQRTLRTSTTWKWLSTRPSYGIGVRLLGRVDQLLGRAKLSSWKQGSKLDYIKLNQVRLHQAESSPATPSKSDWIKTSESEAKQFEPHPTTRMLRQLLGCTPRRPTTRLRRSTTLPWTKLSNALIFYIPDIIRMSLWPYHLPLTAVSFLG